MYMKDIVERHKLKDDTILDALTDAIYSSVGSLSNPHRLAMTTGSLMGRLTTWVEERPTELASAGAFTPDGEYALQRPDTQRVLGGCRCCGAGSCGGRQASTESV